MINGVPDGVRKQPSSNFPGHAAHDELLVTRYAAKDAYPEEVERARRLVEQCSECARLADDIRLISRNTGALPAPARRRDFRLSPEQAESLRGSFLDRFLRRLAAPGMAAALRPVAGVALSIGLVLVMAGVALPQAATPADLRMGADEQMEDAASPAAQEHFAPGAPAYGPDTVAQTTEPPMPMQADEGRIESGGERAQAVTDYGAGSLIYAGLALAVISFAVLLVSLYARRRADDPLLR